MSGTLSISGAVDAPAIISPTTLAANYTQVSVTIGSGADAATYTGASVYSLISTAKFLYPTGSSVKNGALRDYVVVSSASGAQVVLSEGEIDPNFGGAVSTDIIATARNGIAIAPELIVPGDVNGGIGGRDIGNLTDVFVGTATVPAALPGTPAAPTLTVSGNLGTPSAAYTASGVAALGSVSQTDSYLAGSTPATLNFTGASLTAVIAASGAATATELASYVVATGSDGYGVVYSGGEIDPAIRGASTALVAYNDGGGAAPSVGGVAGALRTTAPGDLKGGRYVSSLDSLSTATPNNGSVLRLYEAALGRTPEAGGSGFWSALLDNGTLLNQVAQGILGSNEFRGDGGAALDNTGFVARLYTDGLGRATDPSGAAFWTGLLNNGVSESAVLVGFTSTAEAVVHGSSLMAPLLAVTS